MRVLLLGALFLVGIQSYSQIRFEKLVIRQNEEFVMDSQADIIVVDTLQMMSESRLVLNSMKSENFIHAKVVVIGKDCTIVGNGIDGKPGKPGRGGSSLTGPCKDGLPAENGFAGLAGGHGISLSLYALDLNITGKLTIDLSGGNGGDGGMGGKGGDGNPGTVHCNGGDGANGGAGGRGGVGGNSGNLMISVPNPGKLEEWIGSLIVYKNNGGEGGRGGKGGYAGSKGLGPSNKHGKDGASGTPGEPGERGKAGTLTFEINR